MKRKLSIILSIILIIAIFTGCNSNIKSENNSINEEKNINFTVPDGLPAISIAKLIKENPEIKKGYNINYSIEQSSENITTSVMKSEPDIVIVPSNLSATAFNKTGEYKIAGTVGFGSFYIGSVNNNQTVEDLKGKEVYNIGKGLTPDIITKSILKGMGIDPDKDINFSYVDGVNELAPIILSGKTQYAVLPEPALSTVQSKNENFNVILNLNEEWKKINKSEYGYPQATIIIKKELIGNDREFVDGLLNKIKESIDWNYENKEDLGTYCEEIGISAKKPIVIKAIDRSNIKYVGIKDSYKDYKTYFDNLYKFDPKTIGGKLPDDEIFMEK